MELPYLRIRYDIDVDQRKAYNYYNKITSFVWYLFICVSPRFYDIPKEVLSPAQAPH